MTKRISLLAAALAVMAFAVPAMAHAAEITKVAKVTAEVGEVITLTGEDVTITSAGVGNITCEKLNLTTTVKKNNGAEFEIEGNGGFTTANCTNKNGAVNVTKVALNSLKSVGGGGVTANLSVTVDLGVKLECTYAGAAVAGGYAFGADTIEFNAAAGFNGGACGIGLLDGSFTAEIGAVPVILD